MLISLGHFISKLLASIAKNIQLGPGIQKVHCLEEEERPPAKRMQLAIYSP